MPCGRAARSALALALSALSLAPACGGERGRFASRRSLLEPPVQKRTSFESPATYRYHPPLPGALLAEQVLKDGRVLLAGQRGERWIADRKARAAAAADELAPEDLVAIISHPSGWTFVGSSGTRYEAKEPLSAFTRSSTPLQPLARVSVAGGVLVGVRRDGALVRSDVRNEAFSSVGPDAVRFADVAISMDGSGLALSLPEALWETRDAGLTWTKAPATQLGVDRLGQDARGGITLSTILGPRRFSPGSPDAFPPESGGAPGAIRSLGVPVPLGPSAEASKSGRAFASQGVWTEVRGEEGGYRLVRGTFGERFDEIPLAVARRCSEVRIAGFGNVLYLVCARQKAPNTTQPLQIQRSTDSGQTWSVDPYVVDGRIAELSLAVGKDGELVMSGVCPPASSGPGCRPAGIHRRSVAEGDAGPHTVLAPAAAPSLSGAALELLFSVDGRVAYAVGRRTKGEALAVFTSGDGARTFEAHDVDSLAASDDDDRARGHNGELAIETMGASEDGTVGFVVKRRGRRSWLVVDEEGRSVAIAKPPVENAILGVAGSRGFAVDPTSRDAYESLDAGATFTPLGKIPVDPCPGSRECFPDVVCIAQGCTLADALSRVGWRPGPRSVLLPKGVDSSRRRAEPKISTPLSCSVDAGEWRHVSGTNGPPGIGQSALGQTTWFVPRQDPSAAAVSVISVKNGKSLPEETKLLEPLPHAEDLAVAAALQIEGVAALRYHLPKAEEHAELRKIEVAWSDLLSGRAGRSEIPDGGPYRPEDYATTSARAKVAIPALLSIASGGVYVRLHRIPGDDQQPTFFVGPGSVETIAPVSWPSAARNRGRSEMVHMGRTHVPLRMDGATLVRARRSPTGWMFDAMAVAYRQPAEFGIEQEVEVAYVNGAAGLHVSSSDPSFGHGTSFIAPFRADGPLLDAPVPVPTQLDLGSDPKPCSVRDRTSTPRIVASFLAGTRRPVLVTDPVEPMSLLLTADAVLHGTPESPCVAAYEAVFVSSESAARSSPQTALIFTDPAAHGWLFRAEPKSSGAGQGFEYRTMTCRADPGAEVPREIFGKEGTAH